MANKIYVFFTAWVLSFIAFNLFAQEGGRKQNPPANTKQETPVKIIEVIVGKWKVKEIYKGNKNITATDTAALNQTIVFNREGRFVSHNGTVKADSGAYRVNEEHGLLYLESVWGDEPTAEWKVWFKKNRMTLQRKESSPHAESFKYVYTRVGNLERSDN